MKALLIFGIFLFLRVQSHEEVDEESIAQLTDELLHEIEKRIQSDPSSFDALAQTGLFDGILPECRRTIINNTIIKTDTSLKNGAQFIGTPEVPSFDQCFRQCCDTENCNTAIYKSREDERVCYLFDCGTPTICEFTEHEDFYSMSVEQSTAQLAAKHENDLDNLAVEDLTTTTTTTTSTTTPMPTTTTELLQVPSALFGKCKTAKDCAGTATDCLAGYCVCQTDYHPQDAVCRKDCTRFQFECKNAGNPLTYPQCIAIYDKCDGIQHCTDNSDEEHCTSDVVNGNAKDDQVNAKDETPEPGSNTNQLDPGHTQLKPDLKPDDNQIQEHNVISPDLATSNTDGSKDADDENTESKNTESPAENQPGNDGDSKSEHSNDSSNEIHESQKSNQSDESSSSNENEAKESDSKKDNDDKHSHHSNNTVGIIEEDFVVVKEISRHSNKTAVITLSLGLVITALLLVFVGCRLRNIRKRLRKGRPMNSNEADYLINGMYL